jgi:hypothetical protein
LPTDASAPSHGEEDGRVTIAKADAVAPKRQIIVTADFVRGSDFMVILDISSGKGFVKDDPCR